VCCGSAKSKIWGPCCVQACGYMDGHEASIFDPVVAPPLRASMLGASGSTVISYDDRMLLHDENMLPLHPERGDRIRAVMARLNAAQLTGGCGCGAQLARTSGLLVRKWGCRRALTTNDLLRQYSAAGPAQGCLRYISPVLMPLWQAIASIALTVVLFCY
jgi:hypothetical protein